jgi:hypothetical protein
MNVIIIELMFIFFLILTSKKLLRTLFLISLIDFLRSHCIINCLIRLMITTWISYFLLYFLRKLSFTAINDFCFNWLVGNWSCIFFSLILWRLTELRSKVSWVTETKISRRRVLYLNRKFFIFNNLFFIFWQCIFGDSTIWVRCRASGINRQARNILISFRNSFLGHLWFNRFFQVLLQLFTIWLFFSITMTFLFLTVFDL